MSRLWHRAGCCCVAEVGCEHCAAGHTPGSYIVTASDVTLCYEHEYSNDPACFNGEAVVLIRTDPDTYPCLYTGTVTCNSKTYRYELEITSPTTARFTITTPTGWPGSFLGDMFRDDAVTFSEGQCDETMNATSVHDECGGGLDAYGGTAEIVAGP